MKRYIITLVAASLLLVPVAAGQQATPEPPDGAPDDVVLVVDEDVVLVDYFYEDGETRLEFYSTEQKSITIAGEPASGERHGTFERTSEALAANTTTTITVASAGGASFWTRTSDGKFVRKPSGTFIEPPYTFRDIVLGAAAAAAAVAIAVLYGAVIARLGEDERGGRIA